MLASTSHDMLTSTSHEMLVSTSHDRLTSTSHEMLATRPRLQALHNSRMSIELAPFVRSLPCSFLTTCHPSHDVWLVDSREDGHTVGVCWLQTPCDHSTGFIQSRVQFLCMGGALPHRASIHTQQLSSIALEGTT